MKKKVIKLAVAALCLIFMFPQSVWAADINITYRTKETAKAGDKVNVEIDVSGSKLITTLGLRLTYDSDKLTYESEAWSEGVKSVNAMTLVSDVENNGGKALNISLISDVGYQGSEDMVTLTFSVKKDYTGLPVELELRDITDKDMQDISASTNVSYQKQEESNNNQNNQDNQNNQNDGNSNENSDNSDSHTGNGNQNGKTYQTGIEIMDFKVLCLGGTFLALGFFCIILKRKLFR